MAPNYLVPSSPDKLSVILGVWIGLGEGVLRLRSWKGGWGLRAEWGCGGRGSGGVRVTPESHFLSVNPSPAAHLSVTSSQFLTVCVKALVYCSLKWARFQHPPQGGWSFGLEQAWDSMHAELLQ